MNACVFRWVVSWVDRYSSKGELLVELWNRRRIESLHLVMLPRSARAIIIFESFSTSTTGSTLRTVNVPDTNLVTG